jgi:hypothetical protein
MTMVREGELGTVPVCRTRNAIRMHQLKDARQQKGAALGEMGAAHGPWLACQMTQRATEQPPHLRSAERRDRSPVHLRLPREESGQEGQEDHSVPHGTKFIGTDAHHAITNPPRIKSFVEIYCGTDASGSVRRSRWALAGR